MTNYPEFEAFVFDCDCLFMTTNAKRLMDNRKAEIESINQCDSGRKKNKPSCQAAIFAANIAKIPAILDMTAMPYRILCE